MNSEPLVALKLSIQRALLGEVTGRLVGVTCGLLERRIQIRAYVSGTVSQQDVERTSCIGAEVIADFPDGYTIEESCVSADGIEPEMLEFWAYRAANE
jgi:hypothetical protein